MKFSERWLREWVNPDLTTAELIQRLTMAGLEVDGSEPAAGAFTGIVVGEVISVAPHPDADKLSVCSVTDGTDVHQVVCGAANVRAGLKVPFARIGAQLDSDSKIKKARLRGVESHGMLCSATELGMADEAEGLLELPADAPVGAKVRDLLGLDDVVIDMDLTPNRGDCLSIAGLAREVGALTGCAVSTPAFHTVAHVSSTSLPVILDSPADCPLYLGRVIRNIDPEVETPLWMQEKLRRGGLRCIDPVVDVTNYVLLELGQPMHAFDMGALQGGICVRRAQPDEKLVLLDGREVQLNPDTLVIADQQKALAMAGVMGGKHSAVGPLSTDIFLESAFFTPLAIAGRARSYGLHTDAAHRYERGVDYNLAPVAMERATELLLAIVGGEPGPVIEASADLPANPPVTLRRRRLQEVLGLALPDALILDIMARLGMTLLASDQSGWTFAIPSWRFDISLEVDLIEELARVHGYDNLPAALPQQRMSLQPAPEGITPLRNMRDMLTGLGYQEIVTYSFVARELDEAFGEAGATAMTLANPISQDMAVMRRSLWPGLIKTLVHNQNRQQTRARLFETGLVFQSTNNKLEQTFKVGCLLWGGLKPEQWAEPERAADFFDIKGDAELLLGLSHAAAEFNFAPSEHPALQPGQTARILRDGKLAGWLGAVHPLLLQALDIPGKVLLMELDYNVISAARLAAVAELSRFPAVRRDLAIVLGQDISAVEVQNLLRETAGAELVDLQLFDLYQGGNVEIGKKSLALGLTFQHPSRTLADTEINPIIDSCIKALEAKFNAELR
jgi:phenylalanyl-tRNA synthetase beta chain